MREGGQIDVRPDPDFVASVVGLGRRFEAGGDRDREEQEREEGGESATAREEPEEPAAGGEASPGGPGGAGGTGDAEPPAAERSDRRGDERGGATDLRGAERRGHRPCRRGARTETRGRTTTRRRRRWRMWCGSWTRRWDCPPKTSS